MYLNREEYKGKFAREVLRYNFGAKHGFISKQRAWCFRFIGGDEGSYCSMFQVNSSIAPRQQAYLIGSNRVLPWPMQGLLLPGLQAQAGARVADATNLPARRVFAGYFKLHKRTTRKPTRALPANRTGEQ